MLRNIARLLTGRLLAQLIVFLTLPVLTRLYVPSAFGIWAILQAYCAFVLGVSFLTLEKSLIEDEGEELEICKRILFFLIVIESFLAAIIIIIFYDLTSSEQDLNSLGQLYSAAIGFFFVLTTLSILVLTELAVKYGEPNRLSLFYTWQPILRVLIQVALPFGMGENIFNLGLGVVIANTIILYIFITHSGLERSKLFPYYFEVKKFRYRTFIHRKKEFLTFGFITSYINSLCRKSVPLLLSMIAPPSAIGIYSFSDRVTGIMSSTILNSIRPIFNSTFNKEGASSVNKSYFNLSISLMIFTGTLFYLIYDHIEALVSILFGQKWQSSAAFIQIIFVMKISAISLSWADRVFVFKRRQNLQFYVQGIGEGFSFFALFLGILGGTELITCLLIYAIAYAIYTMLWNITVLTLLGYNRFMIFVHCIVYFAAVFSTILKV